MAVDYIVQTGVIQHKNKTAGGLRISKIKQKASETATEEIIGYEYEATVGESSVVFMNP